MRGVLLTGINSCSHRQSHRMLKAAVSTAVESKQLRSAPSPTRSFASCAAQTSAQGTEQLRHRSLGDRRMVLLAHLDAAMLQQWGDFEFDGNSRQSTAHIVVLPANEPAPF